MKKAIEVIVILVALFVVPTVFATGKQAPLSPAFTTAKTVCLMGPIKVVDKMYDELQKWGRYKVVPNCEDADIGIGASIVETHRGAIVVVTGKDNIIYQDVAPRNSPIWEAAPGISGLIKNLRKRVERSGEGKP